VTESIKSNLLRKREKPVLSEEGALSTGSTLLNLACSDNPNFGFVKGRYYYLVGDSASGKTWTSLTCFAEACKSKGFQDYRLIFDDVEGGAMMDIEHYFGKDVAKRIEPPAIRNGKPIYSTTVESFYYHISDILKEGDPFIYVLDSQDSLTSDASAKKFTEQQKAEEKKDDKVGSYGDAKAKYHSEHIRLILAELRHTGSILIIIGQTRDNLGFGFETKTRSGGRALRFYATLEIWTSVAGKVERMVRGKERTVGVNCLAEVKKNRVDGKVGKDRAAKIPILYDVGIDDVGSCVDYLITEQHWAKIKEEGSNRKIYDAHDIFFKGSREKIVQFIENEDLEEKVRGIVAKVWAEVEEESRPVRKRRYE
jgi:RecA/RadA recombinase